MRPGGQYRKGTRFEKVCAEWFRARGCFVVEARGSHGVADLVVVAANGNAALVQCKSYVTKLVGKKGEVLRDPDAGDKKELVEAAMACRSFAVWCSPGFQEKRPTLRTCAVPEVVYLYWP